MDPNQNEEKKIEYKPENEGLPTKRKIDPEIQKDYKLEVLREPQVKDGQYCYANPGDFVTIKYKAWVRTLSIHSNIGHIARMLTRMNS